MNSHLILRLSSVLIVATMLACGGEIKTERVEEVKKDSIIPQIPPLVQAPVPGMDPKFEVVELSAEAGGHIIFNNTKGSAVHVPPSVLVDSAGNLIKGKVTFRYREFHDASRIFLAGIPMDYDAAGMLKRFETAGMFELRAEQNGKKVFIDSGQVITTHFGGEITGGDYHFFYLDEEGTRNWHYIGDEGGKINPEREKILRSGKRTALKVPLGPDYFSFNYMAAIDVFFNDNLASINANRNSPRMKTKFQEYGFYWSNIYNYQSIDYDGRKQLASLLLWKNLSGIPFPEWTGKAESILTHKHGNVYQIEIDDKKGHVHRANIEAMMPLKSLFAFTAQEWKTKYEETLRKVKEDEKRLAQMANAYRMMEINEFGIYNYDRFMTDQEKIAIRAEFKFDRDPGILQNVEVCYVGGSNRSLVKFPYEKWNTVILVPDKNAKLFALLPGNFIALFDSKKYAALDFKSLGLQTNPSAVFEMVTVAEIKSEDDLRKILLGKQ